MSTLGRTESCLSERSATSRYDAPQGPDCASSSCSFVSPNCSEWLNNEAMGREERRQKVLVHHQSRWMALEQKVRDLPHQHQELTTPQSDCESRAHPGVCATPDVSEATTPKKTTLGNLFTDSGHIATPDTSGHIDTQTCIALAEERRQFNQRVIASSESPNRKCSNRAFSSVNTVWDDLELLRQRAPIVDASPVKLSVDSPYRSQLNPRDASPEAANSYAEKRVKALQKFRNIISELSVAANEAQEAKAEEERKEVQASPADTSVGADPLGDRRLVEFLDSVGEEDLKVTPKDDSSITSQHHPVVHTTSPPPAYARPLDFDEDVNHMVSQKLFQLRLSKMVPQGGFR